MKLAGLNPILFVQNVWNLRSKCATNLNVTGVLQQVTFKHSLKGLCRQHILEYTHTYSRTETEEIKSFGCSMQLCLWCGKRGWKVDRCGHLAVNVQTELLPVTYLRLSSLITISFLVETQMVFLIIEQENGFDSIHRVFINVIVAVSSCVWMF